MVTVVVVEFGVMRCQPLRRALCFIEPQQNQYINFNGKTQSDLEVFLF